MMSSCLFGQSGPLERYAGFGTMGASLAGFFHLTGWPDRPPCGPFGAYSDYMSPRFALCALLAALDHRRRTGEGQYLDFAQAEAACHFLDAGAARLRRERPRRHARRQRRRGMAPHGVYPSAGDDAWVAVACRDDADWRALAGAARAARPRRPRRRRAPAAPRRSSTSSSPAWTAGAARRTTARPR